MAGYQNRQELILEISNRAKLFIEEFNIQMRNYFSKAEENGHHQLHLIGQYVSGFTSILLHRSSPSEQKYESGKSCNKYKNLNYKF